MLPVLLLGSAEHAEWHDTGRGHPEQPARLYAVERGVAAAGLGEALGRLAGRPAGREELLRVHGAHYLDALRAFVVAGGGDLDPDTHVSEGSWDAALFAAGTGLVAVEALQRGEGASAFVAVRPPGHHAMPTAAMGFCLLNNVAVTAAALADRGERVVIVDWDVHHGNGTQAIFWDDLRVLYVSTHQWPSYPGTGRPTESGGPSAAGLTINLPLPPGATGDVARMAFDEIVTPAVESFGPTWVLISAGFDAHRDDPLAGLAWSAGDYADLTTTVAGYVHQPGRVIAFLEGGYDLNALSLSVGATTAALAGERFRPEAPTGGGPGRDAVAALAVMRDRQKDSGF